MDEGAQQGMHPSELDVLADSTRTFRRLGLGLVVLLLAQLAVTFLFNLFALLLGFDEGWLETMSGQVYIAYGALYLVGLPLMLRLIGPLPDCAPLPGARVKLGWREFAALLAVLFALAGIIATVMGGLIGEETQSGVDAVLSPHESPWALFIIVVMVAPVMEEYVFRYLPYRKLGACDPRLYVLWTAVAFGLFHMDLVQSLYTMAVGLVLGVVMIKTGSLRNVIGLHMCFNFMGVWGFGGVILRSENEIAVLLYGLFHLILLAAGLIFGLRMIWRGFFTFEAMEPWTPGIWKPAFCNVGFFSLALLCTGAILVLLIR